jgi:hypothetical protein
MQARAMLLLALAAAVTVSGCDRNQTERAQDGRICLNPPRVEKSGGWGDCVHRWAYRLARSPDPAEVVAKAAVTACASDIAWQFNNAEPEQRERLLEDINRSAPQLALFHVVQARAGNCNVPE